MSAEDAYERKRREPHSPDTAIVCPSYLTSQRDKREFERYAEMLDRLHVWSELDAEELARYVMAEHAYEDYMRMLRKAIRDKDTAEASRIQRLEIAQAEQARKSASALGMTITSRCKLVVPIPNNDEALDV
jgi:P27 family predicted phage terminase small subunit